MLGGEDSMMMKGDDTNTNTNTNMFYEDVFGTIEDFLDFSNEEVEFFLEPQEEQQLLGFEDHHPPLPPPPPADVAPATDNNTFQCEDIDVAQLEWLSNFVEESFSPTTPIHVNPNGDSSNSNSNLTDDKKSVDLLHYRTPSPVSVLQDNNANGQRQSPVSSSSSSCSSLSTGTNLLAPMSPPETANRSLQAPRTKRPRPPSVPRSHPLLDDNYTYNSNSNSLLMVPPVTTDEAELLPQPEKKKAKKLKIVSAAATHEENSQANVRKCMHCEITKTPQWRAGPMGPKTLCNACGVRYKSGRLFPEYRPAASPTFVASQHSNSHKKVIEMRVKSTKEEMVAAAVPVSVKGCELINYIRSN